MMLAAKLERDGCPSQVRSHRIVGDRSDRQSRDSQEMEGTLAARALVHDFGQTSTEDGERYVHTMNIHPATARSETRKREKAAQSQSEPWVLMETPPLRG